MRLSRPLAATAAAACLAAGISACGGSSHNSSSASSMYSSDLPVDNSPTVLKDSIIPAIFSRRKAHRDDPPQTPKRPQISGPFNFQHVAHKQRENHGQPASQMETRTEFSATHPNVPPSELEGLKSATVGAYHPPNLPSEPLDDQEPNSYDADVPLPSLVPRHTNPSSDLRRLMKHARSQDELQRSPTQAQSQPHWSPGHSHNSSPINPIPPPRISSRQSSHQEEIGRAHV